ncbi:MAG: ABC transporter ATP-binding protein [Candidatus Asgardarchaeia archaeon]|nr:ABC transporter ATP-binding protein [Candidatus Odinarchaeota archaeon]
MIICKNLTKYYDNHLAVDHISFHVKKGEIFGFLGPNGAGKTTTVRMLSCLTKISEGEAFVNGYSVLNDKINVKRSIGVVQDIANLFGDLTVKQNLRFMAELYHVDKKRVDEVIKQFKLPADKKFNKLSFGFRKRAVLAAAVLHNPPILFLDEPTVGLDVRASRNIQRMIVELNKNGHTIFLTTHNMAVAEKLSDRIAIINKGKIVALGTPQELKSMFTKSIKIEVVVENLKNGFLNDLKQFHPRAQGNTVIFSAKNFQEFLDIFYPTIKKYGIKVKSITSSGANIEEVFLEVTK